MSKNEGAKVVSSGIVDDTGVKDGHRGFQSRDAMAAAVKPHQAPHVEGEALSAEVADHNEVPSFPAAKEEQEQQSRMVKVRSREYIPPFFYGKKQYSLPAGKDVLLPLYVRRHLEEKGLL